MEKTPIMQINYFYNTLTYTRVFGYLKRNDDDNNNNYTNNKRIIKINLKKNRRKKHELKTICYIVRYSMLKHHRSEHI